MQMQPNQGMIRAPHPHHRPQRPQHNKNLNLSGGGGNIQKHQHQQQSQQQQPVAPFPQFPQCANDVLYQVSEFVKQRGQNANYKWNRKMSKDLQDMLDNKLFCLTQDKHQSRLNPLQHLKLLGIVCTYFQKEVAKEADPQLRYLHFDLIFCGREGETRLHKARIEFLIQVCSLATQYPVYTFFEHVAQWLSKVSSDELKRSYAEQIVDELMDGFVLPPKEKKLYEYLVPLAVYSFEFCTNFVIFSITSETIGPILAFLFGEWIAPRVEQFLHCLLGQQMAHLGNPFCAEKFNILLRYDCSAEAGDDEMHHKFHCALIEIPLRWKQAAKQHNKTPRCDCLLDAFHRIDSLPIISQKRLLENVIGCLRADFLPPNSREQFVPMDQKRVAGPNGTLWQSLALTTKLFPIFTS